MPDLAEICEKCKAKTEKSIDNYIEELQSLKDQNEALKAENDELKNRPTMATADPNAEAKDLLISLIAPSVERWENLLDMGSRIGDDMALIVSTYRIVVPRDKQSKKR